MPKTCMDPTFKQGLDVTRPHTLLTENTKWSGCLVYRYDDTQETITVPNIWYNQTFQTRVAAVHWDAKLQEDRADHFKRYPPFDRSPEQVADIVRRLRQRAARIRAEADRMEAAGQATHPVAVSQMPLNYGENAY